MKGTIGLLEVDIVDIAEVLQAACYYRKTIAADDANENAERRYDGRHGNEGGMLVAVGVLCRAYHAADVQCRLVIQVEHDASLLAYWYSSHGRSKRCAPLSIVCDQHL